MNLHEDPLLFRQIIEAYAEQSNIPNAFIEKDYWLSSVLKKLSLSPYRDRFVFKGGTSLSKAYGLIERFSEDVDLALLAEGLTGNQVKSRIDKVSKEITSHLEEIIVETITKKWSRFRRTAHKYPTLFPLLKNSQMLASLVVELNAFGTPFPFQDVEINSMLGHFLKSLGREDVIQTFSLQPFKVQVLHPERTLGEKVLALARASYHSDPTAQLQNKIRHTYDLHVLMIDTQLQAFVASDRFFDTLQQVQKDDADSREFHGEWNQQPLSHALIFSDTEALWQQLAQTYTNSFRPLVYGALPKIEEIRASLRSLNTRLQVFDGL